MVTLNLLFPVFLARSDSKVNKKAEGTLCDGYTISACIKIACSSKQKSYLVKLTRCKILYNLCRSECTPDCLKCQNIVNHIKCLFIPSQSVSLGTCFKRALDSCVTVSWPCFDRNLHVFLCYRCCSHAN